jgi:hypothetical protein
MVKWLNLTLSIQGEYNNPLSKTLAFVSRQIIIVTQTLACLLSYFLWINILPMILKQIYYKIKSLIVFKYIQFKNKQNSSQIFSETNFFTKSAKQILLMHALHLAQHC